MAKKSNAKPEAVNPNAFIGKAEAPTDPQLAAALGPAKATWDQLLAGLGTEFGADLREWKCYSPKWGWSLRVKRKARTIVWLAPFKDAFEAVFILGEKAMKAAGQSKFPVRITKLLENATKYPEGTGVRLVVSDAADLETLKKLAAIKVAN